MWYKLSKNLDLGPNYWKILNAVKMFWKSRFCSNFAKLEILVKIFRKISILVKNHENIDFVENLHKIMILVKIFENLDFGQNL